MVISPKTAMSGVRLALLLTAQLASSASAQGYGYYANPSYYNPYYQTSVFNSHPFLTGTVVGGLVGAAGGAAVSALQQDHTSSNLGTDAAIGAGTGAALGLGVGAYRNSQLTGSWF